MATARNLLEAQCKDCLDKFFSRRLTELFEDLRPETMVRDRFWVRALLAWAKSVSLTIVDVECKHARNKRSANNHCTAPVLSQFAAQFVARQARGILNSAASS